MTPPVRLFAYGTLRAGETAHRLHCRRVVSVEPATVTGRLHVRKFLVLETPREEHLAAGSADAARDLALQEATPPRPAPPPGPSRVAGDLIRLAGPETLLHLDEYEAAATAGDPAYVRVLLTAWTASGPLSAWSYVLPER